jgi:5-methylcytosine-specific restriction endonuclease McrA
LDALARAFAAYGGSCFYCEREFPPQKLSTRGAHRDHVIATSKGGSDRLHNLVIACQECGTEKANRSIRDFRPSAADKYVAALERHIARALGVKA